MNRQLDDLDRKIVAALAQGPLSTATLARRVGEKRARVAERCRELKRARQLVDLGEQDLAILASLRRDGHLDTPALAGEGPAARPITRQTYQRCLRMADQAHVLTSRKVKSKKVLFFFPGTGDVLGRTNFSRIQETVAALQEIARQHPLPAKTQIPLAIKEELRREYRSYLGSLAAAAEPPERTKIQGFEQELMRVLDGTTMTDVVTCVSLRGFHPKVRDWRITPEMEAAIDRALRWLRARHWVEGGKLPGIDETFWVLRANQERKRSGQKRERSDPERKLKDKAAA